MKKKDHRLAEMEKDFPKLVRLLKGERVRKTVRLEKLRHALSLCQKGCTKSGHELLYALYRLHYGRYPDENIMKRLRNQYIPPILPYLKEKGLTLFN